MKYYDVSVGHCGSTVDCCDFITKHSDGTMDPGNVTIEHYDATLQICYVTMKHYSIIIKKSKDTLELHVVTDHHCDINVKGELRYYNAIS